MISDTQESYHDFTCINSNPFYVKFSKINIIAAGPGAPPITFRRYQHTGNFQKTMPNGETSEIGTDIQYREILTKKKNSGESIRNGVFSCTTSYGGKENVIPVFSHLENNSMNISSFFLNIAASSIIITLRTLHVPCQVGSIVKLVGYSYLGRFWLYS